VVIGGTTHRVHCGVYTERERDRERERERERGWGEIDTRGEVSTVVIRELTEVNILSCCDGCLRKMDVTLVSKRG
jgi:hypothetical protein